MGEGYECDRCGSVQAGPPDTLVTVGDGVARSRLGEHREITPPEPADMHFDVCPSCREEFEQWWGLNDDD